MIRRAVKMEELLNSSDGKQSLLHIAQLFVCNRHQIGEY
jgi:hypothetical protein